MQKSTSTGLTLIRYDLRLSLTQLCIYFCISLYVQGMTPLQCACMKGHSKIVWLLLENGGSKAVRTEVSFLVLRTYLIVMVYY